MHRVQLLPKPPEVQDWSEHKNVDGKSYYYNSKTMESIWDKPHVLIDWEGRLILGAAASAACVLHVMVVVLWLQSAPTVSLLPTCPSKHLC